MMCLPIARIYITCIYVYVHQVRIVHDMRCIFVIAIGNYQKVQSISTFLCANLIMYRNIVISYPFTCNLYGNETL